MTEEQLKLAEINLRLDGSSFYGDSFTSSQVEGYERFKCWQAEPGLKCSDELTICVTKEGNRYYLYSCTNHLNRLINPLMWEEYKP